MALMRIKEYQQTHFTPSSAPSDRTIRKWVDDGEVFGKVIGGIYYIDPDKENPVNDLVSKVLNQ
jgi:hypothetical protein